MDYDSTWYPKSSPGQICDKVWASRKPLGFKLPPLAAISSTFGKQILQETNKAKTLLAQKMKITKTGQRAKENKLDQVYCAWLIKWVVKREIIQLAQLCLTRWLIISGTWRYWVSIWRYWLVLDQYKLVLLDIRWYRVSKGLVCLYILEKVEIWSGVTDAWQTDNRR